MPPLRQVVASFVGELRAAGIPVGLTENLDAMDALRHVPIDQRQVVHAALAATLIKNQQHQEAFDTVFDVFFSVAPGDAGEAPVSAEELGRLVDDALGDGDEALVKEASRHAVARYAGMEPGRLVNGNYYLRRVLRQIDLDGALQRLLALAAEGDDALGRRLVAEAHRHRADRLRAGLESEIRRRLVAVGGPEAVARTLRRPLPEDTDFMHATGQELAALRRAVVPLAAKLAARLARRRRRGRRGSPDFRATVRQSLQFGGVPADPRFRRPHPSKPEIFVLADVSGSVAAFSRFTLQMVYALSTQFARVRSWVFVDGIDEVTAYFRGNDDIGAVMGRIDSGADVVWADGHSNYGHALEVFWARWGHEVGPRTTVLVLGDARNNYHPDRAWVLAEMSGRARRIHWLNPEPRSYWDTGDSIAGVYARHCDGAHECRNLTQLEHFVERLA
ncbi:MAG: vWA domain-containing protein [Acidimicrobiales bacterium]